MNAIVAALIAAFRDGGRGPLDLTGEIRQAYAALPPPERRGLQEEAKAVLEAEAAPRRAAEAAAAAKRREQVLLLKEEEALDALQGLVEHVQGYPQDVDARRVARALAGYGLRLVYTKDGFEISGDLDAAIRRVAPLKSAAADARRAARKGSR
jgi:hypothetical protein